ncbi:iron uptake transporter permease EfeU [Cellulomonas alba]|uniref:Iron uptake transporter permease EfeU n=1 Tax=Cellulomonas alba TaxID=3053467 RepID=A0ABT7SHQ1_9CELL|nr:iron uptake transporter permease EfeU [Cellulomonas alba]MDM7855717.1 iron uptake transporter permease EfeU [Cellulomonas alba]
MLATLVIGLREGLEAALIVGILAAFLKRNGSSLRPMWLGVAAALLLSVTIGVGLELVSMSLPQRAQEGMETVVGAVALVFVTGMVVWMSTHARGLKKDLEAHAGAALKDGTTWAVAGMAFLAIVKEGFETSVFLLATFQNSTSVGAAALGAVLGIGISVVIGIGLYQGGIRFNLGRFFQVTSVFLVLVAAGLVMGVLRTAHESGWLTIGQTKVADLSWLAPYGSVQAALITGVLGIRADPRAVEVLGWTLYLVPLLAYVLWPPKRRAQGAQVPRLQLSLAAGLAVVGLVLVVAVPAAAPARAGGPVDVVAGSDRVGTADVERGALVLTTADGSTRTALSHPVAAVRSGVDATRWTWTGQDAADLPATLTLTELVALAGGRLPVGVDPQAATGPYDAAWTVTTTGTAWTAHGSLLDATQTGKAVVTLSGGGLQMPRAMTVATLPGSAGPAQWQVDPATVAATADRLADAQSAAADRTLWNRWLPLVLLVAAAALAAAGLRHRRALRAAVPSTPTPVAAPAAALPVDA